MFVSQGLFPADVSVGEVVANALTQVGVKVEITKIEAGSYWDAMRQDRANIKWDIGMFGFNPSNASGLYHLASLFKSNADDAARPDVWNMARYRNPEGRSRCWMRPAARPTAGRPPPIWPRHRR